jgi:hypothetical protein
MPDYKKDREEYHRAADAVAAETPWTIWKGFTHIALPMIAVLALGSIVTRSLGWWGEAADVAQQELGPKAMLKKYEWFVDQASRIDKMDADVALYGQRVGSVDAQYASYGPDKSAWPPAIQIQYNHDRSMARDDLMSIVSQRNNLVREYNAQSEKFNWEPFNSKSGRPRPRYDESPTP